MKSIESLKNLYATAKNLPKKEFLSTESKQEIQNVNERIENLFVMPILNFLFERNYKKLLKIKNRLNQNTSLYLMAKFAASLCADETDFDFLTNPENLGNYKKLKELSEKLGKEIPGYVNVLQKICDNKSLGLYSEFQEVILFFDEVGNTDIKNFKIVFEDYKRILKLQTQKIFQEFVAVDFFEKVPKILFKYKNKIRDENSLILFIYGELFFALGFSNEHENILLKHISFCIQYLLNTGNISIEKGETKKYFLQYDNIESRVRLFFQTEKIKDDKLIVPFLKDYSLNDSELLLFFQNIKDIFEGKSITINFNPTVELLENIVFSANTGHEIKYTFLYSLFKISKFDEVNIMKIEIFKKEDGLYKNKKKKIFVTKEGLKEGLYFSTVDNAAIYTSMSVKQVKEFINNGNKSKEGWCFDYV